MNLRFKQDFELDNFYGRQRSNSFEAESPTLKHGLKKEQYSNYSNPDDILDQLIDSEPVGPIQLYPTEKFTDPTAFSTNKNSQS